VTARAPGGPAPPGVVIWLTGRPATGKTTVARALIAELQAQGRATLWLDSDDLRAVLTPEARYDDAEREHFYQALIHLAALGSGGGAVVVVSATAHRRAWRDAARARVGGRFLEVWLQTPQPVLEARDPKGLYRRAAAGEIAALPGVGIPYEDPTRAEATFNTAVTSPQVIAREVLACLT